MLHRIQEYLRVVAPLGRNCEQIGPFLATFTPDNPNPGLSYALPDNHAEPTRNEIASLEDAYTRRSLRARLEYIPDCAPAIESALVAAGFAVQGRLPVMVTNAQDLSRIRDPSGIELRVPRTDDELYEMAVVQAHAYDAPELLDGDLVQPRRAALAAGDLAIVAVDRATEAVVGAGICSQINDGLTEVAAIAVSTAYRRRGIGAALATRLGDDALSAGARTPWLMADGEAERRIFERAGYRTIGKMLHIST